MRFTAKMRESLKPRLQNVPWRGLAISVPLHLWLFSVPPWPVACLAIGLGAVGVAALPRPLA